VSRRPLPTLEEARAILAAKRTRPQARPPPPAGRALSRLIKELDAKYGQGAGALTARWREVVGPEIARRTEPVKLVRGRNGGASSLEIRVAGPSAAIIQHQAHEILARVNLFLGPDAVQKLRIVQAPLHRAEQPTAPRRRAQPLDAAAEAKLSEDLAQAPDGRLKDALLALGRGVLKRHGQG
jgi:hypothetical protein